MEWEQHQRGRPTISWRVPMCAAWVDILCVTQIPGEYRINCISLLILLILLASGNTYLKMYQVLCLRQGYVVVAFIMNHLATGAGPLLWASPCNTLSIFSAKRCCHSYLFITGPQFPVPPKPSLYHKRIPCIWSNWGSHCRGEEISIPASLHQVGPPPWFAKPTYAARAE